MVQDFIEAHPQHLLLAVIRDFILEIAPHSIQKIRYGIPFFDAPKAFCYLNPVKTGIDVSFLRGFEIMDDYDILEARNRKQVKSVIIQNIEDLENLKEALASYILQTSCEL